MDYSLRELSRKDISSINKWRNNKELIDNLGAPYRFIDEEIDNAWYDNYLKNRHNTIRCSIVDKNDSIIGLVSLTDVDCVNKSAVFHIMIGDSNMQNKGIGTFAVKIMLKHAFNNMNLHRVQLEVLSTNERAIAVYEKAGFKKEGELKEVFYKNGSYVNAYIMAVLDSDFKE